MEVPSVSDDDESFVLTLTAESMSSGFPYPLPWSYIPANIYLIYRFLRSRRLNPKLLQLLKYREACGVKGKIPCMFEGFGDAPILLPSTPAIDFDFFVPPHVTPCGPIIRTFEPLDKVDSDLSAWLRRVKIEASC